MMGRFFAFFIILFPPILVVYWMNMISNNGVPDGKADAQRDNSIPHSSTQTTFAGVGYKIPSACPMIKRN